MLHLSGAAFNVTVKGCADQYAGQPCHQNAKRVHQRVVRGKVRKQRIDDECHREVHQKNRVGYLPEISDDAAFRPGFKRAGAPGDTEGERNDERNRNTRAEINE